MMEDFILLFMGTICAFKAAYEQDCHSKSHHDGEHIRICRKPVDQAVHIRLPQWVESP